MVHIIGEGWKTLEDVGNEYADGYSDASKQLAATITATLKASNFVIALYGLGGYEGWSYVLYHKDGVFYENEAGHCSCYGLEGQWNPQETDVEALKLRLANGSFSYEADEDRLIKMYISEYLGA
jgi:hypothetical protein